MRLWEVFRFEIGYQASRVSTWLYPVVLTGLTWRFASEVYVEEARSGGFAFNSPFVIAAITVLAGLPGLLVPAALAGDAGARDPRTRLFPLLYTAPVRKAEYLGGRFLAAFGLGALILLAVPAGALLAGLTSGLEPELLGRYRPEAYLDAYAFLALPNLFLATALAFALATLGRRVMAGYAAGLLLFVASVLSWQVLARGLGRWQVAKLLDPLGVAVLSELSLAWSAVEKDRLRIALDGSLLSNRLLWCGLAVCLLALTYGRFRFAQAGSGFGQRRGAGRPRPLRGAAETTELAFSTAAPVAVAPAVAPGFGFGVHLQQTLAVARQSFRAVARSWGGAAVLGLTVFLVLFGPEAMEHLGVPLVPTTARVLSFLAEPLTDPRDLLSMMVPLLVVVYAGELAWRERDAGLAEIADAAPVPAWARFLGKLLGLGLGLVTVQALTALAGVAVQARLGHHDFEAGLYSAVLFGLHLADYLLFAVLALALHALVDHKYTGHLVVLLAYGFMAFAPELGVEHNLLVYGSDPGWAYSDMRGFEPWLAPWLAFKLYWAAGAVLLAVAAKLLWARGTERGLRARLRGARRRWSGATAGLAAAAAGAFLLAGAFLFFNTNVLNPYRTAAEGKERRAEYERRYGRYQGAPQPRLAATHLRVDLHPERRRAEVRGTYRLVNRTGVPIDRIHLATASEVETRDVRFDRAARRVLADQALGHRIYALERPLLPGEALRLAFEVRFRPRGFPNRAPDPSVVANGTRIDAADWLPAVGYQRERELDAAGDRRAHGLPPRPELPTLEDVEARRDLGGAERIAFEAVVATSEDQVAVAPGRLLGTWTESGRRYFHYATDAPIRNDYAVFSAAYEVHEAQWNGVAIQVLHHPGHGLNLDRMVRSVQASLADYTERFGPYPHGQLRLVEHPGAGNTLHAYPVNVSYQEGFSLLNPGADPRGLDLVFAVVAHEVAHQWWGNRLTPAPVEGAPLLTESLAWYSALGVVERTHGPEHLARLLEVMREAYGTPRAPSQVPLLRAADWFDGYRKGPLALYALRERIGEERVDAALRRLLETHGDAEPPLATSLDLYRELRAVTPEPLHALLADLFEGSAPQLHDAS